MSEAHAILVHGGVGRTKGEHTAPLIASSLLLFKGFSGMEVIERTGQFGLETPKLAPLKIQDGP